MKRNEKILVYGVTGFLVAILVIAVVFGNEDLTQAVKNSSRFEARTLQELFSDPEGEAVDSPLIDAGAEIGDEAGASEATAGGEEAPDPEKFIGPLAVVQPIEVVSPEIISVLGKSRREGNYRVVAVQTGDTFSGLVHGLEGGAAVLEGETALMAAQDSGQPEVVEILKNAGAEQ